VSIPLLVGGVIAGLFALAGGVTLALSKEIRETRQGRDVGIAALAAAIAATALLLKAFGIG
jgi:hypothetical protein